MARREVTDASRRDASWTMCHRAGGQLAHVLADFADSSGTRIAYDRGTLEIRAPSFRHEQAADLLADIVKAVAEVQGLEFVPAGSTTFKREDVERAGAGVGRVPDGVVGIRDPQDLRPGNISGL